MKRSETKANMVRGAESISASARSRSGKGRGKRSESALGAVKEEAGSTLGASTSEVQAQTKGERHRPEASEMGSLGGLSLSGMRLRGRRRGSTLEKYSKSSSFHV